MELSKFIKICLSAAVTALALLIFLKLIFPNVLENPLVPFFLYIVEAIGFTFCVAKICGLSFSGKSFDRVAFVAFSLYILLFSDLLLGVGLFDQFWNDKGAGLFLFLHGIALFGYLYYKFNKAREPQVKKF